MLEKHKVKTKYNKEGKIKKIIACLIEHQEGVNPKTISAETGIQYSTIRNLLRNKIPEISQKGLRGIYHYVGNEGYRVLFDWTLQNASISCELPFYLGERIQKPFGDKETAKYDFEIGSSSKKATLHLSAQIPINLSSISSYCTLFKILVQKYANFEVEDKDIVISTIEFQKDFKNLRLDGVNSITLTNLLSQFKLYNKEKCLRLEHKIINPITAEVLLTLLSHETKSIDMLNEIHYFKERARKIENYLKRVGDLLERLLKKSDNRDLSANLLI